MRLAFWLMKSSKQFCFLIKNKWNKMLLSDKILWFNLMSIEIKKIIWTPLWETHLYYINSKKMNSEFKCGFCPYVTLNVLVAWRNMKNDLKWSLTTEGIIQKSIICQIIDKWKCLRCWFGEHINRWYPQYLYINIYT